MNEKKKYEDLNLDGPSELEFTQALEKLKQEDRDLFENTGLIHVDRDMPAQTQVHHVVTLTRKRNLVLSTIYTTVKILAILSVLGSGIGLFIKYVIPEKKQPVVTTPKQDGVDESEDYLNINETTFPDTIFRNYVMENYDTDQDGSLSPEERNSALVMMLPEDTALTNLEGIQSFPLLQSLTCQHTGITNMNLSTNEKLKYLNCNATPLQTLDLTNNLELVTIYVEQTQLSQLLLPQQSQVKELYVTDTVLQCEKNEEGYFTTCQ